MKIRTRSAAALSTATMLFCALLGCSPSAQGVIYSVGDCLKTSVNEEGMAVKTDCSDPQSFEVTMLAKNGGRPNCPYYMTEFGGAAYLTDAVLEVTYCGIHNGPY